MSRIARRNLSVSLAHSRNVEVFKKKLAESPAPPPLRLDSSASYSTTSSPPFTIIHLLRISSPLSNSIMPASASLTLPSELLPLLHRDESDSLPPLRPTKPFSPSLKATISSLSRTFPVPVVGILHLLNDDLDAAHTLVQDDDSNRDSNLIHSILHRREGDFWNSKWWLNQFTHPFLTSLYSARNLDGRTGAKQFVDMVDRITSKGATTACAAQRDVKEAKDWQRKEHSSLAEYLFEQYDVSLPSL